MPFHFLFYFSKLNTISSNLDLIIFSSNKFHITFRMHDTIITCFIDSTVIIGFHKGFFCSLSISYIFFCDTYTSYTDFPRYTYRTFFFLIIQNMYRLISEWHSIWHRAASNCIMLRNWIIY